MRTVFFLLLSLALHVTALSYPVLFLARSGEVLLPVVILASGDGDGSAAAREGGGENIQEQRAGRARREPLHKPARTNDATKADFQAENKFDSVPTETAVENEGSVVATGDASSGSEGDKGPVGYTALGANSGLGGGSRAAGGIGYGNGHQTENGGGAASSVGVSYAYTPKPEYPYSARREGREGTVVLRVLVDEDGKSKSLEVSRSSGFETLDQAAIETVQRWRFNSARYGNKRVESWVKIPIVFRLAEPKN